MALWNAWNQTNSGVTGGASPTSLAQLSQMAQQPQAGNFYQNPGQVQAQGPQVGGDQSLAGLSPEQQYWAATKALGWDPNAGNQYRGQQQQLIDYLNAHGATGWQGGGMKADDWLQDPSGGQWDYITSGGNLVFNPDSPSGGGGQAGAGAPNGMTGNPGSLIDDPGYQFQLGEGLKALQRSAAARGTLLTGGTLKGLEQYAQNFANTAYQNAFNRNMGVAQLGLGAAENLGGIGSAYGRNMGQLYGDQGNAQAGGTMGRAGQWQGALGDLGNLGQQWLGSRNTGVTGNWAPGTLVT